jgi:hypothetical protein
MAGMDTVHTLIRDTYVLTLTLDEVTGGFRCVCKPPPNDMMPHLNRTCTNWIKLVANGWARRRAGTINYGWVRVESNGVKNGEMRGKIAVEPTAKDIEATKIKQTKPSDPTWAFRRPGSNW